MITKKSQIKNVNLVTILNNREKVNLYFYV